LLGCPRDRQENLRSEAMLLTALPGLAAPHNGGECMEWKNDAELFELLRSQLHTAVVGDVLDSFGQCRQFLPAECRPLRPHMLVAGRAMTVLEVDVFQEPDHPFGLMFEALDSLQPNEVYIAAGASPTYALWGELMSNAARARGATGAVLTGMSRDTRGILAMDFPVFCYGSYAQDQRCRGQVTAHHVPLEVAGVHVRPGDIVFGDIDGVLIIPREMEADVVSAALEKSRKEKNAIKDLSSGRLANDVFKAYGIF
jgi:regulator of RNase E activity RraA